MDLVEGREEVDQEEVIRRRGIRRRRIRGDDKGDQGVRMAVVH